MPLAERTARATWKGDLMSGGGEFTVDSSVGGPHAVSWAARTESPGGKTSPEELIAAAHATCFSMALSNGLAKDGHPAEQLDVTATCVLDRVDGKPRVTEVRLHVRGRVPGMDAAGFEAAAGTAKDGCPVSNALKGNVRISVSAELA